MHYNVTLRRVRLTIFAVEKQYVLSIMGLYSCLVYRAWKAQGLNYIVICGLSGCTVFLHIIS